jgi:hypothetical protein
MQKDRLNSMEELKRSNRSDAAYGARLSDWVIANNHPGEARRLTLAMSQGY